MSTSKVDPTPTENDGLKDSNQHYITRAYLDKFIHPESAQPVLFPYRKGGGPPCKPTGTRQIGSAINFYRQRVNGTLTDALDEARKASETLLFSSGKRTPSSISKCVFDEQFSPTRDDVLHLAAAAAFLYCGSPVQIHNTAMFLLLQRQIDLLNSLGKAEAHEEYRREYGELASAKITEDRERILDGDLFADVGRENWKQLGFESFQLEGGVIQLLLGMRMTVVTCHPRLFFVTTDNPVVRTYPSVVECVGDEVWFPISYKRGILWHSRRIGAKTRFGYSETMAINRRAIKHAFRRIYSPLRADWVRTAAAEAKFNPMWGHYDSLRTVIERATHSIVDADGVHREIVDFVAALRVGAAVDVVAADTLR
jgi:Protein of unknown function (DUF4238)